MAARVGTGVTSTESTSDNSFTSAAKTVTAGSLLVAFVKWETNGQTLSTVSDGVNTWTIAAQGGYTGSVEPFGALCYAPNAAAGSTTITFTFSGAVTWKVSLFEEFSGIATSSPTDQSAQTGVSNTGTYTTSNITTTTPGLVVIGVADFSTLNTHLGTAGNPDFTVGATAESAMIAYLLSGSAQTVTPGCSASGFDTAWFAAQAFKDAGGGGGNYATAWLKA